MTKALLLAFAPFILAAADVRLTSGVADYQVLQRNPAGTADLKLAGTATDLDGKSIEARLSIAGKPVRGFGWKAIANIQSASWSGELKSVPTGGPYTLELRTAGASPIAVRELLVGDLWVLAGQSNMEGVGDLKEVQTPDSMVHSFDMSDRWGVAREPLHTLPAAVDRVHWRNQSSRMEGEELRKFQESRKKGAGLGLPFAVEMVKRTNIPIGLVPCAHGGTSMAQWDPALKDKGGESLYGAMLRRVHAAGGRVKGVLWYQGESDANAKAAPIFRGKFEALIAAIRSDFGAPDLPFYYVQLGRHIAGTGLAEWNIVQNEQRLAETSVKNIGVVAAVDLTLDDGIHISTPGLKTLGRRLADVATMKGQPGPRVQTAAYSAATGTAGVIRVRFAAVNGKLVAQGRPSGFNVIDDKGAVIPSIYRVDLETSDAVLHIQGKLPPGAQLMYGMGKDPYCNITDEARMAALVFGPIAITQ